MRYYFEPPNITTCQYGEIYVCNHPVYSVCTLFKIKNRGLAVIQQHFDPLRKATQWDAIDLWLNDPIYTHPGFWQYFDKRAREPDAEGLYPTVTVRQIMWALRMKPLPKERWETVFDRKEI